MLAMRQTLGIDMQSRWDSEIEPLLALPVEELEYGDAGDERLTGTHWVGVQAGGPKRKCSKAEVELALLKSGGVVTDAAALLGYHTETLRIHVRNSPEMQSYIETVCRPTIDDLAEGVIVKDIKAGSVGTAKWWSERANRP